MVVPFELHHVKTSLIVLSSLQYPSLDCYLALPSSSSADSCNIILLFCCRSHSKCCLNDTDISVDSMFLPVDLGDKAF
jgi:hypothetical protein